MKNERLTMDVAQFGRLIGISRNSAYTAVKTGEVRSIKIGGRIVIPRSEIQRLLGPEITVSAFKAGAERVQA